MYFWKIQQLKAQIRQNTSTQREYLHYSIAYITLYGVLLSMAMWQFYSVWGVSMLLVQFIVAAGGTYYLYYVYQKISRETFAHDLFSVGFVFLLRSIFFMSLGMLNLYFMTWLFSVERLFSAENTLLIGLGFEFLLYWRIGKHLVSLGQPTKA